MKIQMKYSMKIQMKYSMKIPMKIQRQLSQSVFLKKEWISDWKKLPQMCTGIKSLPEIKCILSIS